MAGLHTEVQQSQDRRHVTFVFPLEFFLLLFFLLLVVLRTQIEQETGIDRCDIINIITRHGSATTVMLGCLVGGEEGQGEGPQDGQMCQTGRSGRGGEEVGGRDLKLQCGWLPPGGAAERQTAQLAKDSLNYYYYYYC